MSDPLPLRRRYLLGQACLYGILDLGIVTADQAQSTAVRMIEGGVDLLQLRAKGQTLQAVRELAQSLVKIVQGTQTLLIINDYPQIAAEVGADGVHVGQDDDDIATVRSIVGPEQLIGLSTHSLEQALAAEKKEPDYIGVGPIFATPTKPDYHPVGLELIAQVRSQVSLPQFCIGGIKLENLPQVLLAGATRVVIVSGILTASDIVSYCQEVKALLGPRALLARQGF